MDMLTLVVEASQPGMCVHVGRIDGRGDIYYHGGCAPRSILVRRMLDAEAGLEVGEVTYLSKVSDYAIAVAPTVAGRRCYICHLLLDYVD